MSGHDLKNELLVSKSDFDAIVVAANDLVTQAVQRATDAENRTRSAEEKLSKAFIQGEWRAKALELEERIALYESLFKEIWNIAEVCLGVTQADRLRHAVSARGIKVK